jgi:hypothetical protein
LAAAAYHWPPQLNAAKAAVDTAEATANRDRMRFLEKCSTTDKTEYLFFIGRKKTTTYT